MPHWTVAGLGDVVSLHLREHWRTWAMAGVLVLATAARCSVPTIHTRAAIDPVPPAQEVAKR